jgi:hypothetical protein
MDAEKIRESLMVDESKLQEELLGRVGKHLALDSKGQVHIHDPTRYTQKDLIVLYLIGVRYSTDAKLRESDTSSLSEISTALGIPSQVAAARLTELRAEGKAEAPGRGESRIVFARVPWIINEIETNSRKNG